MGQYAVTHTYPNKMMHKRNYSQQDRDLAETQDQWANMNENFNLRLSKHALPRASSTRVRGQVKFHRVKVTIKKPTASAPKDMSRDRFIKNAYSPLDSGHEGGKKKKLGRKRRSTKKRK